jgi:hypothetical protein
MMISGESITLPDPGYPENDLTQVGYKFLHACGMTLLFWNRTTLADCFTKISATAPDFLDSQVLPNGVGKLRGRDDSAWLAYEGPDGALVAFFCFPDMDSMFMLRNIMQPLEKLPSPWSSSIGTVNANVPTEVAAILKTARAVPAWELPGLEHAKPDSAAAPTFPALLRDRLIDSGWELLAGDGDIFRAVVNTDVGRTQLLFFGRISTDHFGIMSPIAQSPDGTVPPSIRGLQFDGYEIDTIAGMVVLVDRLPAGPPSPPLEEINTRGVKLASYADRVEADLSTEDTY